MIYNDDDVGEASLRIATFCCRNRPYHYSLLIYTLSPPFYTGNRPTPGDLLFSVCLSSKTAVGRSCWFIVYDHLVETPQLESSLLRTPKSVYVVVAPLFLAPVVESSV